MKNKRNQNQNLKIQTQNSISKFQNPNSKLHSGITLIALVVTVVVLLILAGVTITLMFGDNNIFDLAKKAGDDFNKVAGEEQTAVEGLDSYIKDKAGVTGGSSTENPDVPPTPEELELEVGSTVSYNPSGTYNWQAKYCSSTKTETTDDVTLNSSTGQDFNISTWKVLSIDETTGKVELVPSAPTTGKVYLGQAQGYNNAVKLLNDACSSLYGNSAKGITARSIKIEDIEDHMTEEALEGDGTEGKKLGAHKYVNTSSNTAYDAKVASPYTTYKNYPVIYGQEIKAVIGTEAEKTTGLGLSDEPANFIERSEGTSTTSSIGAITTATSIQPYQTYWYKDATFMQTAFEPYKEGSTYYNLIMPQGTSTTYWVASRCVSTDSDYCNFYVRLVGSGNVGALYMYNSYDSANVGALAFFPVVTLSSELLKPGTETDFTVQL